MRSPGFPDDGEEEGGLANVLGGASSPGKPMTGRACMLSSYHGYTAVVMLGICLSFSRFVQCKEKLSTPFHLSQVAHVRLEPCCGVELAPMVSTIEFGKRWVKVKAKASPCQKPQVNDPM